MVQAEYQTGGNYLLTATLDYGFAYSPPRENTPSFLAPVDPRMVTCTQTYFDITVVIGGPAPLAVQSQCSDDGQQFVTSSRIGMMVRYVASGACVFVCRCVSVLACSCICVPACVCVCVRPVHCLDITLNSHQRLSRLRWMWGGAGQGTVQWGIYIHLHSEPNGRWWGLHIGWGVREQNFGCIQWRGRNGDEATHAAGDRSPPATCTPHWPRFPWHFHCSLRCVAGPVFPQAEARRRQGATVSNSYFLRIEPVAALSSI